MTAHKYTVTFCPVTPEGVVVDKHAADAELEVFGTKADALAYIGEAYGDAEAVINRKLGREFAVGSRGVYMIERIY